MREIIDHGIKIIATAAINHSVVALKKSNGDDQKLKMRWGIHNLRDIYRD